jgi:hypothetical protein
VGHLFLTLSQKARKDGHPLTISSGRFMPTKTIQTIQKAYFSMLESHFAHERREFEKIRPAGVREILDFVINAVMPTLDSNLVIQHWRLGPVSSGAFRVYEMLTDVADFWKDNALTLISTARQSDALSCVADDPWLISERHIRIYGSYFDTICIRDPLYHFYRLSELQTSSHTTVQFFVRVLAEYFTLINRRSLFVSDTEYPICLLYPNPNDDDTSELVDKDAYEKTRVFVSSILERPFDDYEAVCDYFMQSTFEQLHAIMRKRLPEFCESLEDRLLRDKRWSTAEEAINNAVVSSQSEAGVSIEIKGAQSLLTLLFRTFQGLNVGACACQQLGADHSVGRDAWQFYTWGLERDAGNFKDPFHLTEEQIALRALEFPKLKWIANINYQDLVRLRELGKMEEIRALFRVNRKRLKTASVAEFHDVAIQVASDLERALIEHNRRIEELRQNSRKNMLREAAGFVVSTGLTVATVAFPALLPLSIGGGIWSVAAGKNIWDVLKSGLASKKELDELTQRPIGILWKAYTMSKH